MMSVQEFRHLAENFVRTSERIGDYWELERWDTDEGYMRQKCPAPYSLLTPFVADSVAASTSSTETPQTLDQADHEAAGNDLGLEEMELSDEEDDSVAPPPACPQGARGEYHVVYSQAYAVPVLYFNIFKQDGKVLSLPEVWSLCPPSCKDFMELNKWTTLTQQEHPILGQPFLQLHPCHTSSLMSQLTQMAPIPAGSASTQELKNRNYLATWLSTVGPLVGLYISPGYVT